MSILTLKTRPTPAAPAPADHETLRRSLEFLKPAALHAAEDALTAIRAERATAAQALRAAAAQMQASPHNARQSEEAVSRVSDALAALDKRIVAARRTRDAARKPLAKDFQRELATQRVEAARLLRGAEEQLQAARGILLVCESFAGANGIDMPAFASLLPPSLAPIIERLDPQRR